MALAALAGALHGACFAPLAVWPLGFVALAPLVAATRGRRAAAGLGLGWVAGTIAPAIAVVPWVAAATHDYFTQGSLGAVLFAFAVTQVMGALPAAAFGVALTRLAVLPSVSVRVLGAAACWTALELARARLFGAPWDLLAHALYAHPLWIQPAELGGAFLVSFVLAAAAAAAGEAVVAPRTERLRALALGAALLALDAGYGAFRLHAVPDDGGAMMRVALVQGNAPNAWRLDVARAEDALHIFVETTRRAAPLRPDLVVWPENAVSFLLAPNPQLGRAVTEVLGADGPPLVVGGPRYAPAGDGRVQFFNSAYLLSPGGDPLAFYDKRRLVPFAEYAPIARLPGLGWRFDAPGEYTPGIVPTVFTRPDRFGVLICFEAIYPELARDLVRAGARLLVNVSNDAWFGSSAGLEQHFAATVFRAVETRRAVARATNTGITGVVGPSGRIVARFPTHVRDAWVVSVPLRDEMTPYDRWGDGFAQLASGAAMLALVAARGKSGPSAQRRARSPRPSPSAAREFA